jgi:hypothetical protein
MELPSTRSEAKKSGSKLYFTGKPCKHGHVAPREVKGTCTECRKVEWTAANERRKALPKSEASKAAGRRYYEKNKDLVKARALSRPAEETREYKRKWQKKNQQQHNLGTALYKRRHRSATPPWLSEEHREQIKQIYLQARAMTELTGTKYVVDHVIPLRGKNVCGLHVPWNLEVMTNEANCRKSNTLLEGTFDD